MPEAARKLATFADLAASGSDGVEIVARELVQKAAPSFEHGKAQAVLGVLQPGLHGGGGPPGGRWMAERGEIEFETQDLPTRRGRLAPGSACRRARKAGPFASGPTGCARCCRRPWRRAFSSPGTDAAPLRRAALPGDQRDRRTLTGHRVTGRRLPRRARRGPGRDGARRAFARARHARAAVGDERCVGGACSTC